MKITLNARQGSANARLFSPFTLPTPHAKGQLISRLCSFRNVSVSEGVTSVCSSMATYECMLLVPIFLELIRWTFGWLLDGLVDTVIVARRVELLWDWLGAGRCGSVL